MQFCKLHRNVLEFMHINRHHELPSQVYRFETFRVKSFQKVAGAVLQTALEGFGIQAYQSASRVAEPSVAGFETFLSSLQNSTGIPFDRPES